MTGLFQPAIVSSGASFDRRSALSPMTTHRDLRFRKQHAASVKPGKAAVVSALGIAQIFAWGTSYYLLAVLALPIVRETGWATSWVVGGLSVGLLAAGIASPQIGRAISRHGGRPVLAAGAALLSAGLAILSLAHSLPLFFLAWGIIGLGMGAGLYDPAFATLGRLYGHHGRSAITCLTLFGGFASTVCWPLSVFLEMRFGWRGACLIYAAFHLCVSLPIYLFMLPREARSDAAPCDTAVLATVEVGAIAPRGTPFILLAVTMTLAAVITTLMSVHLLTVLQDKGLSLTAAVGAGAVFGPAQVAARTIEVMIAKYHHPIWTKIGATFLVAAGIAVLFLDNSTITAALMLYGAGVGLESIARGTLPLAIFGSAQYPVILGRIARPSLIAQATAPSIGAILLSTTGLDQTLTIIIIASVLNGALALWLAAIVRPQRGLHGSVPRGDENPICTPEQFSSANC